MNSFEIEQFGEIVSAGYRKSNDEAVKIIGNRMFFLMALQLVILALLFVLVIPETASGCL
ncbi:hypothetical protein GTP44_26470 [Duganella sp. FT50W]|uniref:Uncharacterized protein n=1 Tax=Duganella lactea TaxID=2692173 RepID=A0A6L8MTN5_9BURK|nr:hypothetical protein [Duganella lactea]MYM85461.1 hypothetical protein [Duganella lactea]